MNDNFSIGSGLEDGTRILQLLAQHFRVDQITVVGNRDGSLGIFNDEGLSIFQMTLAGGGVAIVADCPRAIQPFDDVFTKDIGNQTHLPMGNKSSAIGGDNATRLLTTVLECIKP